MMWRMANNYGLIINLPPRHLKSVIASVAFPAWLLGNDPTKRIAVISHSQSLATDLAIRCHRIMRLGGTAISSR